jgi:hypothetical protein
MTTDRTMQGIIKAGAEVAGEIDTSRLQDKLNWVILQIGALSLQIDKQQHRRPDAQEG